MLAGLVARLGIFALLAQIGIIAAIKVAGLSSAKATWQPQLRAVGTLRAARGADLALAVAGLVARVNVRSGEDVRAGQLLLELVDTDEVANLHQLEAQAALSQVTYERAQKQIAVHVIAQADYDRAAADLKVKRAAVAQQQAIIARKQLRAPFAGRAGIVTLNPGTYLNAGTVVTTLQPLDPVYVDFFIPQRDVGQLKQGQRADLTLDAYPGRTFPGTINAISPKVDSDTRNVQVEAEVPNHDRVLRPGMLGMFANVRIDVGTWQDRTDDARWLGGLIYSNPADRGVLGLIYFNPADPAYLAPNRLHFALNWGNPWAWVMAAGLFGVAELGWRVRLYISGVR
jgi:membrane fusion protein (multidrug efflux system)